MTNFRRGRGTVSNVKAIALTILGFPSTFALDQYVYDIPPSCLTTGTERTQTVRIETNMTGSDITVGTQWHHVDSHYECTGSSASSPNPPWGSAFLWLFNTPGSWDASSGGTVHALKVRTWYWHWLEDEGTDQWHQSANTYTRYLNEQYNFELLSEEHDATGGNQGGG